LPDILAREIPMDLTRPLRKATLVPAQKRCGNNAAHPASHLTGCVERGDIPGSFMLTQVRVAGTDTVAGAPIRPVRQARAAHRMVVRLQASARTRTPYPPIATRFGVSSEVPITGSSSGSAWRSRGASRRIAIRRGSARAGRRTAKRVVTTRLRAAIVRAAPLPVAPQLPLPTFGNSMPRRSGPSRAPARPRRTVAEPPEHLAPAAFTPVPSARPDRRRTIRSYPARVRLP
jgi:hypothetical protein